MASFAKFDKIQHFALTRHIHGLARYDCADLNPSKTDMRNIAYA